MNLNIILYYYIKMSSSEVRNRSHSGVQNNNALNKWASNKAAIEALPSDLNVLKKSTSETGTRKNLRINFIKCEGVIAPVSNAADNKQFKLTVSKMNCFISYTDFNASYPDESLVVKPVSFPTWYQNEYSPAKHGDATSHILPYEPSTIVSYIDTTGKRLNYICKITDILYNPEGPEGHPLVVFTFDTSKVVFYNQSSYTKKVEGIRSGVPIPIQNNPEVSHIDTNFLPGKFRNIRMDFDPIYKSSHRYNADFSFFLESKMTIVKDCNEQYTVSIPTRDRYVGYRRWSPKEAFRNQELEVYVDNISYFPHLFKPVFDDRDNRPKDFFTPSTTIELKTKNGHSITFIVKISDTYLYKDNLIFNLDSKLVKMYDKSDTLVTSYKSVNKILEEGKFTQVRTVLDIDGCGSLASGYCDSAEAQSRIYNGSVCGAANCTKGMGCHLVGLCCTTYGPICSDECNCLCNKYVVACGYTSPCSGWRNLNFSWLATCSISPPSDSSPVTTTTITIPSFFAEDSSDDDDN